MNETRTTTSQDSEAVTTARRLYTALNERNAGDLLEVLDPSFVGIVSDGMPCGVGGRHEGAERMLRDCWGPVFAAFEVRLEMSTLLACENGQVLAMGRYVGEQRDSDHVVDAAFAHLLSVEAQKIVGLEQVTDTRQWGVPPRRQ